MRATAASLFTFASRAALAGALLAGLAACNGEEAPVATRPVLVVQPGAAGAGVSAFAGEVRAREEPPLAFRIGGKLARRLADVGDQVQAGQPLAELEASDVRLQVESAQAALASADSDLALARAELERHKNLFDKQLISRSLYETRAAQAAAAQARVRQARAQASVAGNTAGYAVLRAPKSGVISQRLADVGEVVAAGQPVYVMANEGGKEVAIAIPEQRVAEFRPGLPLAVELWAMPGKRLPAKLREIAPAADPQTRTYAARVSFDGAAVKAEVGQSARVFAQSRDGATLAVPLSAIVQDDKDGHAVWVVREKTVGEGQARREVASVTRVPVKIGAYGEERVPVLSGLAPSDWVVAAGAHLLKEGQLVRPVDNHDRAVALAPAVAAPSAQP